MNFYGAYQINTKKAEDICKLLNLVNISYSDLRTRLFTKLFVYYSYY